MTTSFADRKAKALGSLDGFEHQVIYILREYGATTPDQDFVANRCHLLWNELVESFEDLCNRLDIE